jgi:hypothetical protein
MFHSTCSVPAGVRCVANGRTDRSTWGPHDISFSRDGATMYVAAIFDDTVILDVSAVLDGTVSVIGIVPNDRDRDGGVSGDPNDISISHQSDPSSDGAILAITDERGGGLQETRCNTDPSGVIGGVHFWALSSADDASPASPRRLGAWFYPNPLLAIDPLAPALAAIGRTERGCTIHVLRNGGNGSAGAGPSAPGFDGVSSLPSRRLTSAHYGAGVWHIDFSGAPSSLDGIAEDARTTWGNTLGWSVMPGADTWSAKEYKGFVYAGDMARGFDVYTFAPCSGVTCVRVPSITPGSVSAGAELENEVRIVRGTSAGSQADFGLSVSADGVSVSGASALTFRDRTLGKHVVATSFESLAVSGTQARITGRATVDGVAGIRFTVVVEEGDATTQARFRIVLQDGYGAIGVVEKGAVRVSSLP